MTGQIYDLTLEGLMAATHNLRGTSHNSFRISKGGPTLYQGAEAPISALGESGDVYIRSGSTPLLYQKSETEWVSLNQQYQSKKVHYTASNYTTDLADDVVFVDTTSNTVTVTLSDVLTTSGRTIVVKDWGGNSETNEITIQGQSTQTIDGSATHVIDRNYESVTLTSDGTHWFII